VHRDLQEKNLHRSISGESRQSFSGDAGSQHRYQHRENDRFHLSPETIP